MRFTTNAAPGALALFPARARLARTIAPAFSPTGPGEFGVVPNRLERASAAIGERILECMSTISTSDELSMPLRSDAEILARVEDIVGRACRRQWWLLFLDSAGALVITPLPLEDYPYSPDLGNASRFALGVQAVITRTDAEQVVFVWERYGNPESTRADRSWARTLESECRELGVAVRAQLLSHSEGVRWLPAEEYR